jgi:DNA replication and repair protein RecF
LLLERLTVADFRNFSAETHGEGPPGATVEFSRGFTVLHGHNGAGKTNLLEALYMVSTLRSFRNAELRTMLRRDRDHARILVEAHDPQIDLQTRLEVRIDRTARSTRRTASVDGKVIRSAADFYGRVQAILFTPEDLAVLRGSPGGRRRFLDRVLFASERSHIVDIQNYEKLLRSRNRVLKGEGGELGPKDRVRLLDTYDAGLAEVGARIWDRRVAKLVELEPAFCAAFAHIHGNSLPASLAYESRLEGVSEPLACEVRQELLHEALRDRRHRDEQRRATSIGPHLDDMRVALDGVSAGDFASQGQARALILAFKIAELRGTRARRGTPPLLLLDDVSSELDPGRNAQLFETLAEEAGQCVLTTTSPDFIRLPGAVRRTLVEIADGRLIPA